MLLLKLKNEIYLFEEASRAFIIKGDFLAPLDECSVPPKTHTLITVYEYIALLMQYSVVHHHSSLKE